MCGCVTRTPVCLCRFVYDSVKGWDSEHKCDRNGQFSCTPDHKMSAYCAVSTAITVEERDFSCGGWDSGPSCGYAWARMCAREGGGLVCFGRVLGKKAPPGPPYSHGRCTSLPTLSPCNRRVIAPLANGFPGGPL
jgi:hypothetical protein